MDLNNPVQVRNYLISGPRADQISTLLSSKNDQGVVDLLNRQDQPGFVSARNILVTLGKSPTVGGLMHYVLRTGNLPDGTICPFLLYSLFWLLTAVVDSLKTNEPLRASVQDLSNGLGFMSSAGLVDDGTHTKPIPANFSTDLLSLETKISYLQVDFGLDTPQITISQVGSARNLSQEP